MTDTTKNQSGAEFTVSPQIRQKYLKILDAEIETLKVAVLSDDFKKMANILHRLKGNTPMYGFHKLGQSCLEFYSKKDHFDTVDPNEIQKLLFKVIESYESEACL